MKGIIAMRSIPGATTKGVLYHTNGCIADCTPSIAVLHHGTNDVSATTSPTEIVDTITDLDGNKLAQVWNVKHHFYLCT